MLMMFYKTISLETDKILNKKVNKINKNNKDWVNKERAFIFHIVL
jgi:hypothetical protein